MRVTFPDDLPEILFYRCGNTCLPTLPRTPVRSVGTSGKTDAAQVCPQIPLGATGWMLSLDTAWRPMSTLPARWMEFLNRKRGSAMDFRSVREK